MWLGDESAQGRRCALGSLAGEPGRDQHLHRPPWKKPRGTSAQQGRHGGRHTGCRGGKMASPYVLLKIISLL